MCIMYIDRRATVHDEPSLTVSLFGILASVPGDYNDRVHFSLFLINGCTL